MKFYSVRDFRTDSKSIQQTLAEDEEIILTKNGKPFAMMLPVNEDDFAEKINTVRRAKFRSAIRSMQVSATKAGLSNMTMDEIDAIIAEVRQERRERDTHEMKRSA